MYSEKSVESIIDNIRIIEEQIKFFQKKNNLFLKNKDYVDRIERLENIMGYLYKRLEEKMNSE